MTATATGASPKDEPAGYPGPIPHNSYLLVGRHELTLRSVPNRRLGQWRLEDIPVATQRLLRGGPECPLNYALLRMNATPIDQRVAVLAVGSNASPPQLLHKFRSTFSQLALPVPRAYARGLELAFSGHVSTWGYIPTAVRAAADVNSEARVFVTFLDELQLAIIDETEPNYDRVTLCHPDGGHILRLESGERLASCAAYRTHHGVLDIRWPPQNGLPSQEDLRHLLATKLPADSATPSWLPPENIRALPGPIFLKDVPEFSGSHLVVDDGLDRLLLCPKTTVKARTYGATDSSLQHPENPELKVGVRGVLPSPYVGHRHGEPCILLDRTRRENRQFGGRVYVQTGMPDPVEPLGLVCRVLHDPEVDSGLVRVDQVVRNALGVEIRETVRLIPAIVPRALRRRRVNQVRLRRRHLRVRRRPLGRRFVVCRVQSADLVTVEQRACAMSPVALSLLGITSGDEVVLQGGPREGVTRCMRLKAVAAPDDLLHRREQYTGGDLRARFPSSRDALAVDPDLPWVFLDQDARESLGLGKLSPVRIRARRSFQLRKDTRELLFVLVLALVGLVPTSAATHVRVGAFLLVAFVAFLLMLWRLGDRLR